MIEATKTYSVVAQCSNCGFRGKLDLPLGQTVNRDTRCPTCQCHRLDPVLPTYYATVDSQCVRVDPVVPAEEPEKNG